MITIAQPNARHSIRLGEVSINQSRIFAYFTDSKGSLLLLLLLLTAIGLSPGGSGYFTCIQNMKLVTNKFKSERYVRSM